MEESNQDYVKTCPYEEAFLDKFEIYIPNNAPGIESYLKKGAKELLNELGWNPPRQNDMNQMSAALHRLGAIKEGHRKKFLVKYIPGKEPKYFLKFGATVATVLLPSFFETVAATAFIE